MELRNRESEQKRKPVRAREKEGIPLVEKTYLKRDQCRMFQLKQKLNLEGLLPSEDT